MISQMRATALSEVKDILGGAAFPRCESPSLRLEKFVRIGGDSTKRNEIDAVVKCQKDNGKKPPMFSVPSGGVRFPAKLKSRLIVNQAGGILENAGLCLHPHFGYPYIPGSAVKGVARHAAWCAWHEAEGESKEALARQMATVFGYPTGDKGLDAYLKGLTCDATRGGCVAFFAAVPDGKADLVTDIVNCHHMKYYGDDNQSAVATDDEAPNPQFFPVVEAGATFLFTLAPLRGAGEAELKFAKEYLIKALTENGVGAKTSAGYGWFEWSEESESAYSKKMENERAQRDREQRKTELSRRIAALRDADAESSAFASEIAALEREDLGILQQSDQEEFNRQKKRLPQLSTDELIRRDWEGKTEKACALSHYILGFAQKPDEVKSAVVAVLRTHPLWKYLRAGDFSAIKKKQQQSLRQQVDLIRAYAKKTPEGKMP